MALFATLTTTTRANDAKAATAQVEEARAAGTISNRSNLPRTTDLLAAVLTAIGTGTPVDVTALFDGAGEKPYHLAHRCLSTTALRPYWKQVQIVALRNTTWKGKYVEGETDTVRGRTVLVCPTSE